MCALSKGRRQGRWERAGAMGMGRSDVRGQGRAPWAWAAMMEVQGLAVSERVRCALASVT